MERRGRVRARCPTWRLRLRSPVQVSTRSPRPLRPASVSRRPPSAHASREISASPRVMSAAIALCPSPGLRRRPAAIAITFFSAPPISTPGHVVADVEPQRGTAEADPGRMRPRPRRATPTSTAVGSPRATSAAKLGPESTTTGCPAVASSPITCDMRCSESVSSPLVALTRTAAAGSDEATARATAPQAVRGHREDDDRRRPAAPPAAAPPASRDRGDRPPGDTAGSRASRAISATSSGSRAHSRTSCPTRARWIASAVPQLPAPSTAIVSAIACRSSPR